MHACTRVLLSGHEIIFPGQTELWGTNLSTCVSRVNHTPEIDLNRGGSKSTQKIVTEVDTKIFYDQMLSDIE